ncbi:MAG: hypothetical protein AAFV19_11945 [Pseudomonadota bacterium]
MQPSWIGWVAFLVLASLVLVTSCQAYRNDPSAPAADGTEASG